MIRKGTIRDTNSLFTWQQRNLHYHEAARLGVVKPALAEDQLLLRAYESHRSIQETLEKEKNRPVILLMSTRVNTKRATKNDGRHVYKD